MPSVEPKRRRSQGSRQGRGRPEGGGPATGKDTVKQDNLHFSHTLLELASRYEQNGRVHQAAELYFNLLRQFPATHEAQLAAEKVLRMAQRWEAGGKPRLALSLYTKLAAFFGSRAKHSGASPEDAEKGEGSVRLGSQDAARVFGREGEIPFVDFTCPVKVKQNFERLGWVQRSDAEEVPRVVSRLRKLKH